MEGGEGGRKEGVGHLDFMLVLIKGFPRHSLILKMLTTLPLLKFVYNNSITTIWLQWFLK